MRLLSQRFRCLTYVGDINGFQASQKAVRAMTYLNPQSAPLNGDITRFTWVDLDVDVSQTGIAYESHYCKGK